MPLSLKGGNLLISFPLLKRITVGNYQLSEPISIFSHLDNYGH